MRLFHAGELSQAILAFEAELTARPENAEAWRMLGTSHAENDEDKRAIACLERAVEHVRPSSYLYILFSCIMVMRWFENKAGWAALSGIKHACPLPCRRLTV